MIPLAAETMEEPTVSDDSTLKTECNLRDPTAAIWPIIRLIVIAGIGYVALQNFYSHGFDLQKDGSTIGLIITAIGGVDVIKRWIATGEVVAVPKSEPKP